MREIKFRAWDKIGKRMGAVTFIRYSDSQYAQISARFKQSGKTVDEWFAYGCEDGSDNIILLQYSGLHDKDGVEIYEFDRIIDEEGFAGLVYWSETVGAWCVDWTYPNRCDTDLLTSLDLAYFEATGFDPEALGAS